MVKGSTGLSSKKEEIQHQSVIVSNIDKPSTTEQNKKNTIKASKHGCIVLAILLYFLSSIFLYQGYDKMTGYDRYYYRNAYVGGDAYNYIINGTYATSYFVLASGCFIGGTMFVGIYLICERIRENSVLLIDSNQDKQDELLPL